MVGTAQFLHPVSSLGNCTYYSHVLKKIALLVYFFKYDFSQRNKHWISTPTMRECKLNSCQFTYFFEEKWKYSHGSAVLYFKKQKERIDHLRCCSRDRFSLSGRFSCRFYRRNNFCCMFTNTNGTICVAF